ncbi:MAG: bifunctional DedA family/phosphatase PAP2 family protein [Pseudomonadota bacterium]
MNWQWLEKLAQQSPELIAYLVGCIAFLESLAVIGLLIPGVIIISGFSILAGQLDLPFLPLWISATLGAFLGDSLSFLLGFHLRTTIYSWKIFQRHPTWLERSSKFFHKYGIYSIFIGRFVGPIRPFIPLTAGIFQISKQNFFTINACAALIWAPVYLLPPYYVGKAAGLNSFWIGFLLFAILLVASEIASQIFYQFKKHYALYFLLGAGFLFSACLIWNLFPNMRLLEDKFLSSLQIIRSDVMDKVMFALTQLGSGYTLCIIPITWMLTECWKKSFDRQTLHRIMLVCGFWIFVLVSNVGLKQLFSIPRPEGFVLYPLYSFSFPSGHAQSIAIATGWLFLIGKNQLSKLQRIWSLRFCWILILAVSFSRLYFGVHRPSDILAGWAIAGFMLYPWIYFSRYFTPNSSKTWGVHLILASLLTIVALHYPYWSFNLFQLSSSNTIN